MPAALTCAALLLNFQEPFRVPRMIERTPTAYECSIAADAELAHKHGCAALTGYAPVRGPDYDVAERVTIMPHDASMRVQVIEAIRAIEAQRGGHMTSRQVYALADRWEECP